MAAIRLRSRLRRTRRAVQRMLSHRLAIAAHISVFATGYHNHRCLLADVPHSAMGMGVDADDPTRSQHVL